MMMISRLEPATQDVSTLEQYLSDNLAEIHDFFSYQKYSEIIAYQKDIDDYILLNIAEIEKLNISDKTNLSFILLLLDVSSKLRLTTSFGLLYQHLQKNNCIIGNRIEAVALYSINVRTANDYLDRYDTIYSKLQKSVEEEDDSSEKSLISFVNYYTQIVISFGDYHIEVVNKIKDKINQTILSNALSFLNNPLIQEILNVKIDDAEVAGDKIYSILDMFFSKEQFVYELEKHFLIEKNTKYCDLISNVTKNFSAIRQISVTEYKKISDNSIFNSLQRGVGILTEEKQLYSYMSSYGNMHYRKMFTAFEYLSQNISLSQKKLNIIDWGCGQAMATMVFFDYLSQKSISPNIEHITLIEPSEIALKRGALHIRKFHENVQINTIHKDLDSIINNDFVYNSSSIKIHLFSNILDVELFSLSKLLHNVKENFTGENYFVCVSPYISDLKTNRLDTFMMSFSHLSNFDIIKICDNKSGQWESNWTRVLRIFKVSL